MNLLTSIELTFESLVPVKQIKDTLLSVGTITITSNQELHLDFNYTSTSANRTKDAYVTLHTSVYEFKPETYEEEYKNLGISAKDFTYEYFSSLLETAYITEVYTEYIQLKTNQTIPITLKSIQLHFADGSFLDYSGHISIFALAALADAA